jgi:hypothetical protein
MTVSPQITFTTLGGHYHFPCPEWGYTSVVNTALIHHPVLPQGYEVWDNGALKDYRTCRCVFTLNATAADTMNDLFREAGDGRGVNATLTLPAGSGFYPFGPDTGDAGAFTVRIVSYKPGKQLEEPFNHFRNELSMVCTAFPAYVLPAQVDEGELTIGGVANLRWPDDWSDSESMYDVTTQLTRNGTPYSVDKNVNRYETILEMICRHNKAAALINHLVVTVRAANLTITPPANTYLFGRDNAAAAYTCQWLDEEVDIIHRAFDRFEFALHFYMVP